MTVLHETIEVDLSPSEAFEAVADFANADVWDPGVVRSELVRPGDPPPTGSGAEYRLTVSFRGRDSEMSYRTVRYDPPGRIVLVGEGQHIMATDTIRFEALEGPRTRIVYTAELRLKGLARVVEPLLGRAFVAMGDRAIDGMRAWLEAMARDPRG